MTEIKEIVRDFQDLDIMDKTYNDVMIHDALTFVNFDGNFDVEPNNSREITYRLNEHGDGSVTVEATYDGGFTGTFDKGEIWAEFVKEISKDGYSHEAYNIDINEDTHTLDEIEIAFNNVSWDSIAESAIEGSSLYEHIEFNFSNSEPSEGNVYIEPTLRVDSSRVDIDEHVIIDDILNAL